jgi:hypothetical protein
MILGGSKTGPCFTSSNSNPELAAWEPFNQDGKGRSFANNPGFCVGIDDVGVNKLTNRKDGYFTITEIEVWEVVNAENLVFEDIEIKKSGCNNQ